MQSPVEVKKKPGEHVAHAVPLSAVVKPAVQTHWPLVPQTPLRQLQVEGALVTMDFKHCPVPVIPSSQVVQLLGHGLHCGPKNPVAHVSHDEPVKPAAH